MALASTLRLRSIVVLAALALAAPRAQAEPVTHQFTAQLTTITNGSGFSLDLTGIFTIGQAATLDYTIERDTPGVPQDAFTTGYSNAITALAFSVGTWLGSGTPSFSSTTTTNNAPYDQYSAQVQGGITAPEIGGASLVSLTYTFDDVQGTIFDSNALPRVFPDLGSIEGKTVTILLIDFSQGRSGFIMATIGGVTTPAQPATWGAVKGLYRE